MSSFDRSRRGRGEGAKIGNGWMTTISAVNLQWLLVSRSRDRRIGFGIRLRMKTMSMFDKPTGT